MKTDLLRRINDPVEYLEQLVYDLNGKYPTVNFKLHELDDLYVISYSDESLDENWEEWGEHYDVFYDKFPCVSFSFYNINCDYMQWVLNIK